MIAVSKTFPISSVLEAYDAGQRHFGESRLQEALPKIEALPKDIVWHFVGKVQSNKAKRISESFHFIHSIDSISQVTEAAKGGGHPKMLIEINVGGEAQKGGVEASEISPLATFIEDCGQTYCGLMTIGPHTEDPEAMRPYFRRMKELGEAHNAQFLSMGMSGNFEVAIEEGATHVRIGTAIFGNR